MAFEMAAELLVQRLIKKVTVDVLFSFQFPYPSQCFCPIYADFFCLIEGLFIDNGRIVIISKIFLIPMHFASAPVVQL